MSYYIQLDNSSCLVQEWMDEDAIRRRALKPVWHELLCIGSVKRRALLPPAGRGLLAWARCHIHSFARRGAIGRRRSITANRHRAREGRPPEAGQSRGNVDRNFMEQITLRNIAHIYCALFVPKKEQSFSRSSQTNNTTTRTTTAPKDKVLTFGVWLSVSTKVPRTLVALNPGNPAAEHLEMQRSVTQVSSSPSAA
jgi:hypothetical protein